MHVTVALKTACLKLGKFYILCFNQVSVAQAIIVTAGSMVAHRFQQCLRLSHPDQQAERKPEPAMGF